MRKKILVLCFLAGICLSSCGIVGTQKSSKTLMLEFVLEHREELTAQIEGSEEEITALNGITGIPGIGEFVRIHDCRVYDEEEQKYLQEGFVYFECESFGLLSSSVQSGFYYSAEDVPSRSIFWASADDWVEVPCEEENAWYYTETEGSDNSLQTSKICDKFYYFQITN